VIQRKQAFFFIFFLFHLYGVMVEGALFPSLEDMIAEESQAIVLTNPYNYDTLADLYVSRGESYLLSQNFEKACEDFTTAKELLIFCTDPRNTSALAFRATFGQAIGYDGLEAREYVEEAVQELKNLLNQIPSCNCISNHQKQIDQYSDIGGPNDSPYPDWCEEVVTGVGRAMDAIACLAPSYSVKIVLIGIIEALITRGVKCCQAGGFWKACVAPITRKWKILDKNKNDNIYPNKDNIYKFE